MKPVLLAAAVYNLLWGVWVVAFPGSFFRLAGMPEPLYPSIWQCVGMIVGVYGIGYAIAAFDPVRHWPIVFVGLLGKIFGPLGYVQAAWIAGTLDPRFGWTIPTNDLIWWAPFGLILWHAFRESQAGESRDAAPDQRTALAEAVTSRGDTVAELSTRYEVLLVLVRHLGCTFCREMLADLGAHRREIEQRGYQIVIVGQSPTDRLQAMAGDYGLDGVRVVSDPDRTLYRTLGLRRGTFLQLFGPRVWIQGLAALRRGHGIGRLEGDGFQMPGAFVVEHGRVIEAIRPGTAGQRIDFLAMTCATCGDATPPAAEVLHAR